MPLTYRVLASTVLTTTTQNVAFSSIPSTFTDLVLRITNRSGEASSPDYFFTIRLNGDNTSAYTYTRILGQGTSVSANRGTGSTSLLAGSTTAGGATSNAFGAHEIYIPNYTSNQPKIVASDSAQETNSTSAYRSTIAGTWNPSPVQAAVTSITITDGGGVGFVNGSSFYLYGIKKS